ncbi:hypothetical protein KAW18_11705 [candidate division WOR-3 bacterium]|nr:hypothetical protein [candidate division WOR-3 bacterium]
MSMWRDFGALFTPTEKTKLAGIEESADVTDATNVNAAGAVMVNDAAIAFDTITEKTTDHGVNLETVNLKDGHINELKKIIFADPTQLTIAAGVVTVTQTRHTIYTQDGDPTDNLDTINGGEEGQVLIINPSSTMREVVVKHKTGNIALYGSVDITLDNSDKMMMLLYHESFWCGF